MPKFEWDPDKAANNAKRHRGVTFEDAIPVFDDDRALDEEDPDPDENRRKIIGMGAGRILVVVYTEREDHIRIISARKATPHEVKTYHDQG